MLHEGDVLVMVSGNTFFVKKRADRELKRQLRLALQRLRQEKEEPQETGYGTERPNRSVPGQRGVDSRLAALMRETDRNRIGTEQSEFQGTPIAFDERGHTSS